MDGKNLATCTESFKMLWTMSEEINYWNAKEIPNITLYTKNI